MIFTIDDLAILCYAAGIISGLGPLALYAWKRGLKLLPADLRKEAEDLEAELCETVRNISVSDLQAILIEAEDLVKGGFTERDAFQLGIMILKAVAKAEGKILLVPPLGLTLAINKSALEFAGLAQTSAQAQTSTSGSGPAPPAQTQETNQEQAGGK